MQTKVLENTYAGTPTLKVSDARGLPVRTVQYYRRESGDPIDTRVSEQRFDAAGRWRAVVIRIYSIWLGAKGLFRLT